MNFGLLIYKFKEKKSAYENKYIGNTYKEEYNLQITIIRIFFLKEFKTSAFVFLWIHKITLRIKMSIILSMHPLFSSKRVHIYRKLNLHLAARSRTTIS